jgi:Spy/CpxP family protein refolding chaperone
MKGYIGAGLLIVAAIGLLNAIAMGEAGKDDTKAPAVAEHPRATRPGPAGQRPGERLDELITSLNLGKEKEAAVRDAFKTYHKDLAELRRDRARLEKDLRDAERDEKAEKAKDLEQQIDKLEGSRKDLQERLLKDLKKELDKEQLAKVREFIAETWSRRPMLRILTVLNIVDLSSEQEAKIQKILQQTEDKIMKTLTEEQRAKIRERLEGGRGPREEATSRPARAGQRHTKAKESETQPQTD